MTPSIARLLPLALTGAILAMPAPAAANAHFTIVIIDGPNEGFNDPTPAAPVGGNPGLTKGQQRLIAFQFAADLWGAALDSNVEITIRRASIRWRPTCSAPLALGSASATSTISRRRAFLAATRTRTITARWPTSARAPTWLPTWGSGPPFPEVVAQFSSDFDFYLGLDNNHGAQIDLVVVLLHEFGHGLGFSSFLSRTTGNTPGGVTDPFLDNTLDASTNTPFPDLLAQTAAVRLAAIQKVDQIVWTGANVAHAVPTTLLFGRPELDAPTLPSIAGSRYGTAAFGPPIPPAGITGSVVVAQDGVGVSTDACEPLTPESALAVSGGIALVDRGTCTFVVKVKNAQNAGAIAVLVADNVPDNPPAGLGGVDPTITISSARVLLATGNAIKAVGAPVPLTIGINLGRRAGTDLADRPQLYASTPIASGSTLNHWDPIAFKNLLMEPAINPDLTHGLIAPFDTTLAEMHDMGWFTDADLNGAPDPTVLLNGCNTGLEDDFIGNGALLSDQARVWYGQCAATTSGARAFENCVEDRAKAAHKDGIISGLEMAKVKGCAKPNKARMSTTQ